MTKIVLSFDDGREDNFRLANEILIPMQIPATFNITTDYITGKKTDDIPCPNPAMSVEDVIDLSKYPLFEIAGHGKEHHNEFGNLLDGIKELQKWCDLNKIGIASPNSKLSNSELEKEINKYKESSIAYVRIGNRFFHGEFIKRCFRKFNRLIHLGIIFGWIYKDSLLSNEDDFILNSIPIMHGNSIKEIKKIIGDAVNINKSCILMFHSILKKGEKFYDDPWSWDFEQFQLLCSYLKEMENEKKLRICKTLDFVSDI